MKPVHSAYDKPLHTSSDTYEQLFQLTNQRGGISQQNHPNVPKSQSANTNTNTKSRKVATESHLDQPIRVEMVHPDQSPSSSMPCGNGTCCGGRCASANENFRDPVYRSSHVHHMVRPMHSHNHARPAPNVHRIIQTGIHSVILFIIVYAMYYMIKASETKNVIALKVGISMTLAIIIGVVHFMTKGHIYSHSIDLY